MKIDAGLMFAAVSNASEQVGVAEDTGFLNRHTGEIVFLREAEGDTRDLWGDDWLKIPKYDRRVEDVDEEEFVWRFLQEQGIDAELR